MSEKVTLKIQNQEFTYIDQWDDISLETDDPISNEDGRIVLEKTKDLFDHKGLKFGLLFGTLLGAVRDKSIIKGDTDVDTYTDNEELLYNILPFLQENGLLLIRRKAGLLYSFKTACSNAYIDVYILSNKVEFPWSMYCNRVFWMYMPKKLFKGYQNIDFLGKTYLCPKNPERFLRWVYGKTWRIPQNVKGVVNVWSYRVYRKYRPRFITFRHNVKVFLIGDVKIFKNKN